MTKNENIAKTHKTP